jgi:hypothetical protein
VTEHSRCCGEYPPEGNQLVLGSRATRYRPCKSALRWPINARGCTFLAIRSLSERPLQLLVTHLGVPQEIQEETAFVRRQEEKIHPRSPCPCPGSWCANVVPAVNMHTGQV